MFKSSVSLSTKRHSYSEILNLGFIWFYSCRIVMERLPFFRISIPVQSSCFDVHLEIIPDFIQHHVKGGTHILPSFLVVCNQVIISVPQLPQLILIDPRMLCFFQQFVVDGQIVHFTEQIVDHKYISSGVWTVIFLQSRKSCKNSHFRGSVGRIEVLCVLFGKFHVGITRGVIPYKIFIKLDILSSSSLLPRPPSPTQTSTS